MCCRDATASSLVAKVRGEVFADFHAVAAKRHSSMRDRLLRAKFLVNNPIYVKENEKHALDFALHLARLFSGLGDFGLSVYGSYVLPRTFI
jgi:hypothetical protein